MTSGDDCYYLLKITSTCEKSFIAEQGYTRSTRHDQAGNPLDEHDGLRMSLPGFLRGIMGPASASTEARCAVKTNHTNAVSILASLSTDIMIDCFPPCRCSRC